ncbi:uncharacterized protein C15orf65 [Gambusia affinis]|uniref:uncharacterized protein C15orf65 n=1 Tax=Gambusia affinis TaxID=33528 RepID=UPI001CDBB9F3|nr:uncharacterized protein C15orf65 [Gambusia affinis]
MSLPPEAEHVRSCSNPGNPVFSCIISSKVKEGTMGKIHPQSFLYRTTSGDYGRLPPSFESAPCSYHPKTQSFTRRMRLGGMFHGCSMNTALDKTQACLQNTI